MGVSSFGSLAGFICWRDDWRSGLMVPGFGAPVSMCQDSLRFFRACESAALSFGESAARSSSNSLSCAYASLLAYWLSVGSASNDASGTMLGGSIGGLSLRCALSSAERLPASLACSTVKDGLGI